MMLRAVVMGVVGATIAYFLDPERGRRRRHMARDRTTALARHGLRRLGRRGRMVTAESHGAWRRATHFFTAEAPPPNDATLARKVESVLFADPDIPKGKINVNAERGVVVLRGELDHTEVIEDIEERVRAIPGVLDVQNLLHLRNTTAPHRSRSGTVG